MNSTQQGPLRLYYIEDDDDDALFFSRAVAETGRCFAIVRFLDPVGAIEALHHISQPEREAPHLIISDLKMPRMNGLEFLRWIHRSRFSCLPVILFSGSSIDADIIKAYHYGACSFITKPADYTGLKEIVTSLLGYWMGTCQMTERAALLTHPELAGINIAEDAADSGAFSA